MIGQTFTLIGNPKLVFRLVWRGSIAGIDCVRGVALPPAADNSAGWSPLPHCWKDR